jgi:hypothetical protein
MAKVATGENAACLANLKNSTGEKRRLTSKGSNEKAGSFWPPAEVLTQGCYTGFPES